MQLNRSFFEAFSAPRSQVAGIDTDMLREREAEMHQHMQHVVQLRDHFYQHGAASTDSPSTDEANSSSKSAGAPGTHAAGNCNVKAAQRTASVLRHAALHFCSPWCAYSARDARV